MFITSLFSKAKNKITNINIGGIRIDFIERTIRIPKKYKIIFEGDMDVYSEENVIIKSNIEKNKNVYINCDEDFYGNNSSE